MIETKIEISTTITANNIIEVRETTVYIEDGSELTRKNHRYCITPIDNYDNKPQKVIDLCNFVFTDEVKTAYRETLSSNATV